MRGKPPLSQKVGYQYRNIPAYAGKTGKQGFYLLRKPEHPRVCGENPLGQVLSMVNEGTSPRMRGKLDVDLGAVGCARNIPAYAGKTG